jgi:hypothetical protein
VPQVLELGRYLAQLSKVLVIPLVLATASEFRLALVLATASEFRLALVLATASEFRLALVLAIPLVLATERERLGAQQSI